MRSEMIAVAAGLRKHGWDISDQTNGLWLGKSSTNVGLSIAMFDYQKANPYLNYMLGIKLVSG